MKTAEAMPESKYSYRPTKDVRSFAELLNHVADKSHYLCSNTKGDVAPATATAKGSKTEIIAYLKGAFDYCDSAFSGFTDAHLSDPADFFGFKTNRMRVKSFWHAREGHFVQRRGNSSLAEKGRMS